ncbi:MAG: radical SAM protein [Bacteroidales bacterium]|nr:radical SAM protein [Bacteroidales bacterium]
MIAFGPVTSRRLGTSLGINNIVSQKKCSYSCVYCQVGNTPNKTVFRDRQFESGVLSEDVKQHLQKLDLSHKPDYLTFVANGEPTLDINLGTEIRLLKSFGIPIAVISNSSLIDKELVRDDLMLADWVSVKVDTIDKTEWKRVNRPYFRLDLDKIHGAMLLFAHEYQGKLCTETMLIEGYNDSSDSLEKTASFIAKLKPHTAYLSIPTRPPALQGIKPVSETKITEAWEIYQGKGIHTELLTGFEGTDTGYTGNIYDDILNITTVHPLREDTVSEILRKGNSDFSVVNSLVQKGLIKGVNYEGKTYYIRSYHLQI